MRKTKKFYKEQVERCFSTAISVLPEIVKKYGKNPKGRRGQQSIRLSSPDSFWNCFIDEFYFCKGKFFASIYWQGDLTDGYSQIQIIPGKTNYRIPAEYYDDGYRTRCEHGDLIIDSTKLHEAIKRLVNSL